MLKHTQTAIIKLYKIGAEKTVSKDRRNTRMRLKQEFRRVSIYTGVVRVRGQTVRLRHFGDKARKDREEML